MPVNMSLELGRLAVNDRNVEMQQCAEESDEMIYLQRKWMSQQPHSQPFSRCPVGQLDQRLIQGTTPNYATRE